MSPASSASWWSGSRHLGRLGDGRMVEYFVYPPEPTHKPGELLPTPPGVSNILFFHGYPGTGAEGTLFARIIAGNVTDPKWRVIAASRAGFGKSDKRPDSPSFVACGCCSADASPHTHAAQGAARDSIELVGILGLDAFSIVGLSGGGLPALCAAALCSSASDIHLRKVSIVAGMWGPAGPEGMMPNNVNMMKVLRGPPRRAWPMLKLMSVFMRNKPSAVAEAMKNQLPAPDADMYADEAFATELLASCAHSFAQGAWPAVLEGASMFSSTPAVDLHTIQAEVMLYQGSEDVNVPKQHAEAMAAALPNATLYLCDGLGHASCMAQMGPRIFLAASYA